MRSTEETPATWFHNGLDDHARHARRDRRCVRLMEHMITAACNPPVHIQVVEDEAFYVLEGEIEFDVGGEVVLAGPGTFALGAARRRPLLPGPQRVVRVLVITSGEAPCRRRSTRSSRRRRRPAARRELPVPRPRWRVLGRRPAQRGIVLVGPPA